MEQPLDFSKSTSNSSTTTTTQSSASTFAVKKSTIQRFNNCNSKSSLKNLSFGNDYHHVNNSEISDENTSRSSASSPDSIENERTTLNLTNGHTTLSQQALLMLAAVSNPMNFNAQQLIQNTNATTNADLNSNLINQLNNHFNQKSLSSTTTSTNSSSVAAASTIPFQLSQQLNNSAQAAAAFAVSNIMNQTQFNTSSFTNNHHLNQSNQTNKSSKSNQANKLTNQSKSSSKSSTLSRKSMIMAKQQEQQQQNKSSILNNQSQLLSNVVQATTNTKFGILSNSQNSNILDTESESQNSPLLNNSLQVSINSNLSGEENSLYNEMFSQDDDGSPRSQRRRGNPIPESLKDDNYWVRRRKNNEAAKKSRDAKRAKDLITAKRAAILENENSQLKNQINQIRNENLILRSFLDKDVFCDNQRRQIDQLILIGRKVDPEKVRTFAVEFFKQFGQHYQVEHMES